MHEHRNHIAMAVGVWLIMSFSGCFKKAPKPTTEVVPIDIFTDSLKGIDLNEIKSRGKIIALTLNTSTSYFIFKGHPIGFEYEMLKRFTNQIGVDLEIKLISDVHTMFDLLAKGEGDIIACNLAVTRERLEKANFSSPYNFTKLVLVQRQDKLDVFKPLDLEGKRVFVNMPSPSYERLVHIQKEMGISFEIVEAPGYIGPERLIEKVAKGEIDYTVVDDNLADLNATYFNNIDVSVQLSFPVQVGWAVRKNSSALLHAINDWFERDRNSSQHAYIYQKYFEAPKEKWEEYNGEYSTLKGNRISHYDELIKEYSDIINWDWRLIAAQMYEESKFQEDARSWAGAFGLMQFMPETAHQYGVDSSSSPRDHIKAAIIHLNRLEDFWQERIPDQNNRIHFTLASYNAGLGHVLDAVSLAIELGYDPFLWENNVAECIKLKSQKEYYSSTLVKHGYCRGEEPVAYVKKILEQYNHYSQVIDINS